MADLNETKKKPPLIPPNFVTLVQLKERWYREQERKQRERDEQERKEREREEQERKEREREEQEKQRKKQEEEKENQSVSKREKGEPVRRRNPRSQGRDNRRYRRKETEELEVTTVCVVTASENAVEEAGSEDLQSSNRRSGIWKKKGKKNYKARAKDEVIGGERPEPPLLGSGEPEELEVAAACVVTVSEDAVEVAGREGLEGKKKKSNDRKWKNKKKDKTRAEDKEVIGGEEQVLPSQGVEEEMVPPRRELQRRGKPRHFRSRIEDESEDGAVDIAKKFGGLSMNGGNRREHRFSRGNYNF